MARRHSHVLTPRNPERGLAKHYSFQNSDIYAVKIENLPKVAKEEDLRERLKDYEAVIVSIRIQNCPESPVNYAYVNCKDLSKAQEIVSLVNKMMLWSKLLNAKIKSEATSSRQKTLPYGNSSGRDISTVKILLPSNLSGAAELNSYFRQYGELRSNIIIRTGNPNYAYVNFKDPFSAQVACCKSPHQIGGMSVVAIPHKGAGRLRPLFPLPPDEEYVSMEFVCNRLAIKCVKEEISQYLKTNCYSQVNFRARTDRITVHAQKKFIEVQFQIKKIIVEQESMILEREIQLECCYLPILADQGMQRKLYEMKEQVLFEVKIRSTQGYVSLEELTQSYSQSDQKTVDSDTLESYLLPNTVENRSLSYKWFWKDDDHKFQPYSPTDSKRLESVFGSSFPVVQLTIGKFNYSIDTRKRRQTNQRTGKEREIRRRPVAGSIGSMLKPVYRSMQSPKIGLAAQTTIRDQEVEYTDDCESVKYNIKVQLKAHSNYLQEIRREITEEMDNYIKEIEVDIPCDPEPRDRLIRIAQKSFVTVKDVDSKSKIVLKGALDVIKTASIQLKEEILNIQLRDDKVAKLQAKKDYLVLPDTWDPQEDLSCELKEVSRNSSEWNKIHLRMVEPGFYIEIIKIERIQNPWLWEVFDRSRKRMSDKNQGQVNEKELFHGTRRTPPKKIYDSEQGFDNRLASTGLWGEGTYFASSAKYSNSYAYCTDEGYKQMFLAQVITGITCKCPQNNSLKAPPKKSEYQSLFSTVFSNTGGLKFEDERYDSVSGVTRGAGRESEIYVIYEHGKVYPAYLITYT